MTNIFGKPLSDVTFDDVKAFCEQQIKEGVNLDYKRDLSSSSSIVKTIAAFGNTRGGWIIVGVDDQNDLPALPALGMEFAEQQELQITNMILSHMWPPLIPTIHVCPPNADNKTFVVIYVPESDDSPHWLFNKTELYIRVGSRAQSGDWERFATSDEWEWLRNKREQSLKLRSSVREQLEDVFDSYNERAKAEWIASDQGNERRDDPSSKRLTLSISPLHPTEALMEVPETYRKLEDIAIRDYQGTDDRFPPFLNDRITFQRGTAIYGEFNDRTQNYFIALEVAGTLLFKQTIVFLSSPPEGQEAVPFVPFGGLVSRVDEFLLISSNLYKTLNYQGQLQLTLEIDGTRWMQMKFENQLFNPSTYKSATGKFELDMSFFLKEIESDHDRYEVVKSIVEKILYSFGMREFNPDLIKNVYRARHVYPSIVNPTSNTSGEST